MEGAEVIEPGRTTEAGECCYVCNRSVGDHGDVSITLELTWNDKSELSGTPDLRGESRIVVHGHIGHLGSQIDLCLL